MVSAASKMLRALGLTKAGLDDDDEDEDEGYAGADRSPAGRVFRIRLGRHGFGRLATD
jgi:hypothetical protein